MGNVESIEGAKNISVNLTTEKMSVEFDSDLTNEVIKAVSDAGYKASLKENFKHVNIKIAGMTCATCVNTIEKSLNETEGVNEATVNFATETASVSYDPSVLNLEMV